MKNRTWAILGALAILGCSREIKNSKINTEHEILVNIPSITDSSAVLSDEIFNIAAITVLQDSSQISESAISDLSSIKKILLLDSIYVILDIKFRVVNAFSVSGKYLFTFNKLGVAKAGSSFPLDISYDRTRNHIFILSNTPNKVMEFTLSGSLVGEYPLSFYPSSMIVDSINKFVFDINFNFNEVSGRYNLVVTDSNMHVKGKYFPYSERGDVESSLDEGGLFEPKDSNIYFLPAYSTNILGFKSQELYSAFKIGFPGASDSVTKAVTQKNIDGMNYGLAGHFFINTSYIGINYIDKKAREIYTCFYDYHLKKAYQCGLFDTNNVNMFNGYIFQSDNNVLLLVNIRDFYKKLEQESLMPVASKEKYAKIVHQLDEESINKNRFGIIKINLNKP